MTKKNKKILSTSINKKTSELMDAINTSIDIDSRLFNQDIKVTKAHALALNKLKILSNRELVKIQKGLNTIVKNHSDKKIKFSRENEDIHMNIESLLHSIIGETASKIHTGRSRNDQVATDTRLWVLESCKNLKIQIKWNFFSKSLLGLSLIWLDHLKQRCIILKQTCGLKCRSYSQHIT